MYFQLSPANIRKVVRVESNSATRRLMFETSLVTEAHSRFAFERSVLQDGRQIRDLRCSTNITASNSSEARTGLLSFVPAFSDQQLSIDEPDQLELQIHLPTEAFDTLWDAVGCDDAILLGGKVDEIPHKDRFGMDRSYQWDISKEDQRSKPVADFWFMSVATATTDAKTRVQVDQSNKSLEEIVAARAELIEDQHPASSQMNRISMKALEQCRAEALRLGGGPLQCERLIFQAFDILDTAYSAINGLGREKTPSQLWQHPNAAKHYVDGRSSLSNWVMDRAELASVVRSLLQNPWLRLDELEWAIVDASVFREVFEFGEHVKENSGLAYALANGNPKKLIWTKAIVQLMSLALRWGLFAVAVTAAWNYINREDFDSSTRVMLLVIAVAVSLWVFVGLPGRNRAAKESAKAQFELWSKMKDAHIALKPDSFVSPHMVRALLVATHSMGAVWDGAALALLDRAVSREPPVWIVT